jgi:hypothetical protein
MTDRELLEAAAKAAGIGCYGWKDGSLMTFQAEPWNPLTDDGDAFRLAVSLRLCISPPDPYLNKVYVSAYGAGAVEDCGDDPYAATRRAIVSAAAEIGRSMK